MSSIRKVVLLLSASCALLFSCSSETVDPTLVSGDSVEDFPPISVTDVLLDPILPGAANGPLVVQVPDSDLVIEYGSSSARGRVSPDYLSSQWEFVQDCLSVTYAAPRLLVVDSWLPTQDVDDVLFSIEGRRIATTIFDTEGVSVVRISTYDFDGSQGNPGFHLRSILARYVWTVNELPIRAYNTACASG